MDSREPEVLLFETSPDGSIDAIVQHDQRTIYLYLNAREGTFGTRACWVRNLVAAPFEISRSDLEQGIPPVLPRFAVNHHAGSPPPPAHDLRVVWFEEGNGIALFEQNDLLAVIPPWSGRDGFHGYARDCLSENEVCWPLPEAPALRERLRRAEEFWEGWRQGDLFAGLCDELMPHYRRRWGRETQTLAVDRPRWPPVILAEFRANDEFRWLTIGMSLRPQPNVELHHERPSAVRRIELGIEFRRGSVLMGAEEAVEILAGQARFPWRHWTWLGHGHRSKLNRPNGQYWHLAFARDENWSDQAIRFRDDPINLLWVIPCNSEEPAQGGFGGTTVLPQGG